MTRNQIEYQQYLEQRRHNLAQEADWSAARSESERHDLATETEAYRSNTAKEALTKLQADETHRHNVRQEQVSLADLGVKAGSLQIESQKLDESIRHNTESEAINRDTLSESQRHNLATETESAYHNRQSEALEVSKLAESARHNYESEQAAYQQAAARYLAAEASMKQAGVSAWKVENIDLPSSFWNIQEKQAKLEEYQANLEKIRAQTDLIGLEQTQTAWNTLATKAGIAKSGAETEYTRTRTKTEKWAAAEKAASTVQKVTSAANNALWLIGSYIPDPAGITSFSMPY